MRDVRKVIQDEGIVGARRLATSTAERVSIEAAYAMMGRPRNDLIYASDMVMSLPHKGGGRMAEWRRDVEEDGAFLWKGGRFYNRPVGVPFGAKSRMILLHLFNEAIRANSRQVTSGSSMYEWARMVSSQSLGGMTYSIVLEHSMRVAAAHLIYVPPPGSLRSAFHAPIIEELRMQRREARASKRASVTSDVPLWNIEFPESILLHEAVFENFKERAAPVRSSALQQLSNNSAAIDLYIGLAARLPALRATHMVGWAKIGSTFGSGYKNARQLKPAVQDVLQLVSAVYPEARVEICSQGLLLHPSPAPISAGEVRSQAA